MNRKKKEKQSKITLMLSLLALFVSIFTFCINYYNQYGKNADFEFLQEDKIICWQAYKKITLNNTITFFNIGAKNGGIYKITAEIKNENNNKLNHLYWVMFLHDENIGKKGEQFKPYSSFENWAQTILVPGRTALQKKIQFKSKENFNLEKGKYIFTLKFYTGTEKEAFAKKTTEFIVKEKDIEKWKETIIKYDSINNLAKSSITIKLMKTKKK